MELFKIFILQSTFDRFYKKSATMTFLSVTQKSRFTVTRRAISLVIRLCTPEVTAGLSLKMQCQVLKPARGLPCLNTSSSPMHCWPSLG